MRTVSWFSCGAASAVATKLALEAWDGQGEFIIASCVVENEHLDNERFLKDCEKWYGKEILRLRSAKYKDCWEVWEKNRYLAGIAGAKCTTEMKKLVRQKFQKISDQQIFGFTAEEKKRAERFQLNNPEVSLSTPLISHGITKKECFIRLQQAQIELPMMYRLGYQNNNCIGCVKGGAGYWNKIRKDFPEIFARMARLEREFGARLTKHKNKRVFLDELPENAGRFQKETDMECGLWCGSNETNQGE
jgi:hypothetical protein